jgi:DNA-binding MarR family transcriptional regulator
VSNLQRRILQAPRTVPDETRSVELSTVLVLDALHRRPTATVGDVADHLQVAHSTASRLVQRAVDAGAVRRRTSHDHRRAALSPTAAGWALRERAQAFRHDRLRHRLRGWAEEEIEAFSTALHRFAEGQ